MGQSLIIEIKKKNISNRIQEKLRIGTNLKNNYYNNFTKNSLKYAIKKPKLT